MSQKEATIRYTMRGDKQRLSAYSISQSASCRVLMDTSVEMRTEWVWNREVWIPVSTLGDQVIKIPEQKVKIILVFIEVWASAQTHVSK